MDLDGYTKNKHIMKTAPARGYFFRSFSSFSANATFFPQRSHLPSSVMQGCFGASPPQIPHLGIFLHLLSLVTLALARNITHHKKAICSPCYIAKFGSVFSSLLAWMTGSPLGGAAHRERAPSNG